MQKELKFSFDIAGFETKELKFSFDITGFETTDNGDYIGMIANNGFTLRFQDRHGNIIPLNKENIEKFLKEQNAK